MRRSFLILTSVVFALVLSGCQLGPQMMMNQGGAAGGFNLDELVRQSLERMDFGDPYRSDLNDNWPAPRRDGQRPPEVCVTIAAGGARFGACRWGSCWSVCSGPNCVTVGDGDCRLLRTPKGSFKVCGNGRYPPTITPIDETEKTAEEGIAVAKEENDKKVDEAISSEDLDDLKQAGLSEQAAEAAQTRSPSDSENLSPTSATIPREIMVPGGSISAEYL